MEDNFKEVGLLSLPKYIMPDPSFQPYLSSNKSKTDS